MVLMLENNIALRYYFGKWLEENNIPYYTYDNADDLLSNLQDNLLINIKIAIIDLAGCDGKQTIPLLKEKFPNIIIIIFTAYTDLSGSYLRGDVDHYIIKSTTGREKLESLIKKYINR